MVTERTSRRFIWGAAALGLVLVVYWVAVTTGSEDPLLTHWTYLALTAVPTALVWVRAATRSWNRPAFVALALGLSLWTLGSVWQVIEDLRGITPPFPSVSDALWLSLYPFTLFGMVRIARARLQHLPPQVGYDVVAMTVTVAAVVISIVLPPVLHNLIGLSTAAQGVNLAYPLSDAVLLAVAITTAVLMGRGGGAAWPLLCAGVAALATADTFWAVSASGHGWQPIMTSNALYPVWPLLVAAVAWLPVAARPAVVLSPADLRILAATLVAAGAALALLVANEWIHIPALAVVLAGVGLLAAINRVAFRLSAGLVAARAAAAERVLLDEFRVGLRAGELRVHFQPLVGADDGEVRGAEALLRWERDGRLIPPAEFIPAVERSDLRDAVNDFVVDQALGAADAWRRDGWELGVSVNLPSASLTDHQLPDRILGLLAAHDVPAAALTLEVTETATITDEEAADEVTRRLSALGVELSVDDFGTGHSSLARIARFPISEVKVDQSFVRSLETSQRPMVATTIQLAHTLGLRVVAEGVEERRTANALRALGCDLLQGYFFARPMPFDEFRTWLTERPDAAPELALVDDLLADLVAELEMDAAFVAEFVGEHEVFRAVAGEHTFGETRRNGEHPLSDSYCRRVVDGIFPNIIRDARRDPLTRDMQVTAEAGIGGYLGIPLHDEDGGLYGTLCCLSHEPRPDLGPEDTRRLERAAERLRPLLAQAGLALARREQPRA